MNESPDVLSVLRARAGGKQDEFRVAVALEGGGMRGVVSGAMLIALRDLGLAQYVDVYYGTSSGSINISYFATDAAWEALSVYPDQLPNGFLRGWARLPHRPVLDMEFLRTVMTERVPLDRDRLATSGRDVRIVLANVDTVLPEIVDIRQHSAQAIDYLMASSWLPLLAGGPFELDGRRYLDGGILWADPLYAPIAEGCTHVLALNTAPQGALRSEHSTRLRTVLTAILNRWSPGLGDGYARARQDWDRDSELIGYDRQVRLGLANVMRLAPAAGSHRVTRLSMDRATLLDGARAGYATILRAFGEPAPLYFSVSLAGAQSVHPLAGTA